MTIVLASGSVTRQRLLMAAGIEFLVRPATIDERKAEQSLPIGSSPAEIAAALAGIKAQTVSETIPGALVIGADQTLDLDGVRFAKPRDLHDAQRQVLRLAGRKHRLHSAFAGARNGDLVWQHGDSAELTMRSLTAGEVARYVAEAGSDILQSVGAYQVEGHGIQLFERIDGDYFTVLGLPLLSLLAFLRSQGELT